MGGLLVAPQDLKKLYLPSTKKLDKNGKPTVGESEWEWVVLDIAPEYAGDIEYIESDHTAGETALRRVLSRIVEWSYTQEDGQRYPITYENVKKLHIDDFILLKTELERGSSEVIDDLKGPNSTDTSEQNTSIQNLE